MTCLLVASLLAACQSAVRWDDKPRSPPRVSAFKPPEQYTVKSGDTLYSIAFRYQLNYLDIARWNGIGRGYLIRPGQTLALTGPAAQRPSTAAATPQAPAGGGRSGGEPSSPSAGTGTSARTPSGPSRAPYRWRWPTDGTVVRRYSAQSKGIEIAGSAGQTVRAAAAGKVVYSGTALKGYGQLLIVKHDESWLTAYGFNRRLLVKEGDTVRAGQPIAEMGIGPSQKARLRFEIRRNGGPVNPGPLLPAR